MMIPIGFCQNLKTFFLLQARATHCIEERVALREAHDVLFDVQVVGFDEKHGEGREVVAVALHSIEHEAGAGLEK